MLSNIHGNISKIQQIQRSYSSYTIMSFAPLHTDVRTPGSLWFCKTCDPCGKMILTRLFRSLYFPQKKDIDKAGFVSSFSSTVNPVLPSFFPSPPQCPFKSFWSPFIQTWLQSHTTDILSALHCCHTQWHATIRECEHDPAHCVPNIFSPADSMGLKSYTCNQRPFGFLIRVTIAEEVSDWVWLLCSVFFPWMSGCEIFRLLYLFCVTVCCTDTCSPYTNL